MNLYPYSLKFNPYPSSPTPTMTDAKILGGTRHKEAKESILSCISEVYRKSSRRISNDNDFRLITLVQDVGSGKTHLALHIKGLNLRQKIVSTYIDLSTISPKTKETLYMSIINGFKKEFFGELRVKIVQSICEKATKGDNLAKKSLKFSLKDKLLGTTINQKGDEIIYKNKEISYEDLEKFLDLNYNPHETVIIKNVLQNNFEGIDNLEELLGRLKAISKIAHNLLGTVVLYEVDEFDSDEGSIEFVKSVVNAHLPSSILLLITTPSGYSDVQRVNPSVFDRLEKANYKINLAGSNSMDELIEIGLEFIKHSEKTEKFLKKQQDALANSIRILWEEFPNFRSVRSIINILYHSLEKANELGLSEINEMVIEETLKNTYPGLTIKGSIMKVPIADFIKIQRQSKGRSIQKKVKEAVSNLVNFEHELGTIKKPGKSNPSFTAVYSDSLGSKVGIAVILDANHSKNHETIDNVVKSSPLVDKLIILTNSNYPQTNQAEIINIDKSKVVDLLYFNEKYHLQKISEPENERVELLAKTISLL